MPAQPAARRRRSTLRRLAARTTVLALTVSLAAPLAHADAPTAAALTDSQVAAAQAARLAELPPGDDADAAIAKAKASGVNVPIPSLTTAFSETLATPAGHFLQTSHPDQQRVKQNGSWVPLDATLVVNPDGTYSPKAVPSGVTLSAGGSGAPLATLSNADGAKLSLNSPFPLSKPTVDGASLLYQVATDTTLKVTATKFGGLSTVIILNSAAAAANPALKTLHFDTTTQGVAVSSDSANNLTAKSPDGTAQWSAPAPRMWDSSTSGTAAPAPAAAAAPAAKTLRAKAAAAPASDSASPGPSVGSGTAPATSSADGPGAGAQVATMPVTATASGIDLTPDQQILSGGVGPWYIDPAWIPMPTKTANAWTWVQSGQPSSNNYNRTGSSDSDYPGVGTCGSYPNGGSCSPPSTYRTFFQFDTSNLAGTVINSAVMNLQEYESADWACGDAYLVDLYLTTAIADGINWGNQPGNVGGNLGRDWVGGAGHGVCQNNLPIAFDVTPTFKTYAPTYSTLTFGLDADDESNAYAFKRMNPQPTLDIQYDKAPNAPSNPNVTPADPITNINTSPVTRNGSCGNGTMSSWGWLGAGSGAPGAVTLNATVSSPVQDKVAMWWHIWDYNQPGTPDVDSGTTGQVNSGGVAQATVKPGVILDGHAYSYSMFTTDQLPGVSWAGPTPACSFRVDMTPPTLSTPGMNGTSNQVSDPSTQFPPSGNGQVTQLHVGQTGYLPYTAVDNPPAAGLNASGIAAVRWGFDPNLPAGSTTNVATAPNLPSQLPVTPTHWGTNIAYIQVEDNAGNLTQVTPYSFYVPWSPTPLAYGDVSGDGRPDVLAADPTSGDLLDYSQALTFTAPPGVPAAGGKPVAPRVAATAAQAPDHATNGLTWKDFRISHRGGLNPESNVDDLFAHQDGGDNLYYLRNDLTNNGAYDKGAKYDTTNRPACVISSTADCTNYGSTWKNVSQITPIGSSTTVLTPSSSTKYSTGLLAVQNDNLWYYPPGATVNGTLSSSFGTPIELTTTGGWGSYDLMIPGDALKTGHPALWVRARNTVGTINAGDIYQYALTFDPTTQSITALTPNSATHIGSNLSVQNWPTIGAVGDLTGDNIPDLWGTTSTGRITVWAGVTVDGTSNTAVNGFTGADDQWLLTPTNPIQGEDASGLNNATSAGTALVGQDKTALSTAIGTALTGSARFDGNSVLMTGHQAVTTTGSYSISAWAKVDDGNGFYTIVSQTANQRSPFYLQYSKAFNNWAFIGTSQDDAANTLYYSAAANPTNDKTIPGYPANVPQFGAWTHLVGTYDAGTHIMTLYVNDKIVASVNDRSAWSSTTPLTIGGNHNADGTWDNQTHGNIAGVQTYPYVLTSDQVDSLYHNE
ncbi:hypothetical protein P3T37_003873 [Kitasatospora sp. MAA4]|uniref:LamG-like jellyroll fold domain-containing protein n=1 Tax=Kitasatospora sp. MAA4 TaxID=3035093 RepID=UPI002473353E|nr:LamG-like jellyroll fold domain-containing protein [Kitasatospora sp. MAA4]MDH6134470.1 hypothetical protein [Kitasatospora sp. MAA4]